MLKTKLTKNDITRLIRRYTTIKGEDQNWMETWDELTRSFFPKRKPILTGTSTEGQVWGQYIHGSTPGTSMLRAAAVLQSTLMNRETDWLDAEISQIKGLDPSKMEDLNKKDEVKQWVEHVVDVVSKELPNSNFYSEAGKYCIDLIGYGHGTFYSEESRVPGKTLYFSAREINEVKFSLDDQGNLIFFGRLLERSAAKMFDRWKENIPEAVMKEYKTGNPEKKFEVYHFCQKRDDIDDTKIDKLNMRFGSYWVEAKSNKVMEESGYNEMPMVSAPWIKQTGEKYGRGPTYDALADTKEYYAREDSKTRVGELISDPPYQMPSSGFMNEPVLRPGQAFYYQPGTKDRIEGVDIWRGGVPVTNYDTERLENNIKDAFFLNQLQLIDKKEMTAEEARIRTIENAKIMGPAYGNQIDGFLDIFLSRVIGLLQRAGKIEDPPEILKDHDLRFKYISPLAKAQAAYEINGIMTVVGTAINWDQALLEKTERPMDKINTDFALDKLGELEGTPTGLFNDEDKVDEIREQRAALQKQKYELEKMQAASQIANTAADTENKEAE